MYLVQFRQRYIQQGGGEGGAQEAKVPAPPVSLNCSFSLLLANFSFRQSPPASAGFRGLLPQHLLRNSYNATFRRGPEAIAPGPISSLNCSSQL